MSNRILPILAFSTMICGVAFAADQPPKLRLSEVQNVQPKSYDADLTLDPAKTTFSGTITIRMEFPQPLQTLWLNQAKLHIDSAELEAGGKKLAAKTVPGGDDFVGLHFDSAIPAGAAAVTLHYTGIVEEKSPTGIFRQQDGGNWYIFTQFEAIDARSAFPCFDEPAYKTPWKLTLRVPSGASAVSNTPADSEKVAGGTKTIVFLQTKPLPSYLVAFSVGPFEYVNAGTVGKAKIPVRIVVPKGRAAEAKYAAEVTAPILSRLEDYFGIPFPYEKSDQVAVPDFPGAMENPGMVTYSQSMILADPKMDGINRQRTYATVAAHELAHQWFGDLVTTQWWDDIWLNEAFATWMERKLIAEWKPEWQTRVGDVRAKLGAAGEDSLMTARKIRQEIVAKDDIGNAFDGITYEKGASVIGMFEAWMGAEEFRKGVRGYLQHYAFKATTAGDFLDSLSSSSGRNVTKAFSTFLNQAGVPVLSVKLQCSGGKAALEIGQKRFVPTGSKANVNQTWSIPVCARFGQGKASAEQCFLLTQPRETVELRDAKGCPGWVQANAGAGGYYRVDYDAPLLRALNAPEIATSLPAVERVDLIGNAQALADGGQLSAADALAMVETFHNDPERTVVQSAISLALEPSTHLTPPALMPNYQRFLQKNFGARAHELGWTGRPGESDDTRLLRGALLKPVATWGGDQQLANEALALTEKWLAGDRAAIEPNMLAAVLGTAGFVGDKALFDRFFAEIGKTEDKQIRGALLAGMGNTRSPEAIEAGMRAFLDGKVPQVEGLRLMFGGQGEEATRKIAFHFVEKNWDEMLAKMPSGGAFDLGSFLPRVGAGFCDAASRDELKAFFVPRLDKLLGAPRALDQVVEGIDLCAAGRAAQGPSVEAFLRRY